jgi:hypothetical protein
MAASCSSPPSSPDRRVREYPVTDRCALFIVGADGTGLEPLIAAKDFHGINTIAPSADGTKVLWVEWRSGAEGRLHLFRPRDPHRSTRSGRCLSQAVCDEPRMALPDGASILFDFFEADGDHWGVVSSAGGTPVRIGEKFATGAPPRRLGRRMASPSSRYTAR